MFGLAKTLSITPICMVSMVEGLFHTLQWLGDMRFDNVDFTLDSKITTNVIHHHRIDVT